MISIESLLEPQERETWADMIQQAHGPAPQAIWLRSQASGVLLVGIAELGELLTWFASPAHDSIEATAVLQVIMGGLQPASMAVGALMTEPAIAASNAIRKASKPH